MSRVVTVLVVNGMESQYLFGTIIIQEIIRKLLSVAMQTCSWCNSF